MVQEKLLVVLPRETKSLDMRTNIVDNTYLSSFLLEAQESIIRIKDKLASNQVTQDRVPSIKRFLFSNMLHVTIARYSIGGTKEEVKKDLLAAISFADKAWAYPDDDPQYSAFLFDWYSKAIWLVSLASLLKLTPAETKPILTVLDNSKDTDWLLEFMARSIDPARSIAGSLVFPTVYGSLKEAVEEKDPIKASALVKRYLEKEWYQKHRQAYWHDIHKSAHTVFFGYWSFEAAAVVKIAGIDDGSFQDNQYYPKDLLG